MTHGATLTERSTTWVEGASGSAYDIDNLPLGIFSFEDEAPRVGARIGEFVVDLAPIAAAEMLESAHAFEADSLNPFLAAGPNKWASARQWLTMLLTEEPEADLVEPHLVPVSEVTMHLPFQVADYVDFYCSLEHATNLGSLLRPDHPELAANWRHSPVAYHGRAGTVLVSGTDIRRPKGMRGPSDFGPTGRLDLEAEVGFVVGAPSTVGTSVPPRDWKHHVFGVTLVNDWSARDIQAFEAAPLGPFLGKSFATSVSAWVTPLDALSAALVPLPGQDPEPQPYLRVEEPAGFDIDLEIELNGEVVSRPRYADVYWSPAQMLAHLTVNGAALRTGDLFASGTVSGSDPRQRGSLLEVTWGGAQPLPGGHTFLEDGDRVTVRATAPGTHGGRIALGEVSASVLPAIS